MRRMHSLFTDFIVLMPLKVKELRVRAEEISRTSQIYLQVCIVLQLLFSRYIDLFSSMYLVYCVFLFLILQLKK